jgi:DNA-directed RNA polymerase specialized sigma24 family protein
MASDGGRGLHDFVAGRYAELRRSAFLMCGDWALADERTQKSLARLVAKSRRTAIDDPDAFVYSHLMASFQRRRSRGRQHLYVAAPRGAHDGVSGDVPSPPVAPRHRPRAVSSTEAPRARAIADIRAVSGEWAPPVDAASARPVPGPVVEPDAEVGLGTGSGLDGEAGLDTKAGLGVEGESATGRAEGAQGVPAGREVGLDAGVGPDAEVGLGVEGESAAGVAEGARVVAADGEGGPDAGVGAGGGVGPGVAGDRAAEGLPEGPRDVAAGDPTRTILVLDALHKLAPRCRAVLVLRHWDGFAVDETADMLGLADERVNAYEAAGLAALDYLLADREPAR